MPTYQYACTDPECGNRFELVQSFTDPSASECPVCGGPVRKVYGSVGVVFKGSGFYRTDSREGGKRGDSTAAKDSSATGTKESGSKTGSTSGSDSGSGSSSAAKESASTSSSSGGSASSSGSSSGGGSSTTKAS